MRDLLQNGLEININSYGGNYLSEHVVSNKEEVLALLNEGLRIRATAETKLNQYSSRSHMLVVFTLCSQTGEKRAKLTFVDLAGSENLKKSGAENERQLEARNINLSLFELANVLRELTIPNHVVNYRNSKLTMMLKVCNDWQ